MASRREVMALAATLALGGAGVAHEHDLLPDEPDKTKKEIIMEENTPFEVTTMSTDKRREDNGVSELTRVYDEETGVLMYAAVSGSSANSLEFRTLRPDEHDYDN